MPGPGFAHVVAAVFTAAFFLLLTVKLVTIAIACGVVAVGACLVWAWELDKKPGRPVDIGGGIRLPTTSTGPNSHPWWATVVLILVAGSLYLAFVFSYLYLWIVSPEIWAPRGSPDLPHPAWAFAAAGLALAGAAATFGAGRLLPPPGRRGCSAPILFALAAACLAGAVALTLWSHWQTGLRPADNAYGAMVYMAGVLDAQLAVAVVMLFGFAIARHATGRLDRERRVGFEVAALLGAYTAGQILFGLLLVHGFPRVAG
jgi:cytochrome c oxidase subunit I+III